MARSPLQSLFAAVRRRLWHARFATAVRQAAWCSAAWMLLLAAAHLVAGRVAPSTMLWPMAALWAALLARAAWLRPVDGACALWADRHLDGASAYTTWLELRSSGGPTAPAWALQSLESWAATRVPQSLASLAGRRESLALARPLLSMLVCGALSAFILALPGATPMSPRAAATTANSSASPDAADRPSPLAQSAASADLASEVARELRAQSSREAPGSRGEGLAPAGAASAKPGREHSLAPDAAAPAARAQPGGDASAPGTPTDTAPPAGSTHRPGDGGGRDAGDSRDERIDLGVSRVLRTAQPVQRSAPGERAGSPADQRADLGQSGRYEGEGATGDAAAARADSPPPAATRPAKAGPAGLSPTEAAYLQTWIKANEQRR